METTMDTESQEGGQQQTVILALDTKSVKPFATQDEYLYAMKEDLAEWFHTLYGLDISVDNFFEQLETGVVMCQHANNVQSFIKEQMEAGAARSPSRQRLGVCLPERGVQYRSNVKPGSFQSRDNVSNFIAWCKALGINNVILFETEDLVLRKNERHVVLCLLEVARRGAQYGMLAPTLVQMEREIDAEIAGQEPEPVPHVQRQTCDLMSLDEMVREMVSLCTCPDQFPMVQVSDGKYRIGDSQTLIFVRILRNHVMVRIGGGWDTLQNYLDRHDPCRCAARGHKGRVAGMTPAKSTTRRQSAPATQLAGLEQRMRTNTPSADHSKKSERAQTPSKQQGASTARSKRSQSVAPVAGGGEPQWKSTPQKHSGHLVSRSLDPPSLPGLRSPSPASSETSQASSTRRSGVVSMSRDSGLGSSGGGGGSGGGGRRETDSASDASSSCGGSPGLHKRFSSANDLSFPKELTLSSVDEHELPRLRPTSARERVRRATHIPTSKKSSSDTSGRGRERQKTNMDVTPGRQARSRSVEPMEFNHDRAKKNTTVRKADSYRERKQDKGEVLMISRDSAGKHWLGPQPVIQNNGESSDLDGYPSGSSRHSSTSSSMSGPTNGYSNGYSSSSEEKRPGTPRVNISPDRILPDKPKLMSRSHTADLGHLTEKSVSQVADDSTDTDTESRTTRTVTTRMSASSNQSSTLSLASSFDDYPDAPPEDSNLNAEMERLFEEYRQQEIKNRKKNSHARHRRSNSADLLEMDDFRLERQKNNAFQKARSSSRELLDGPGTAGPRGSRSRRSSNASVESSSSTTRQVASASATPRRTGTITPTPTKTSSLRTTLGMAREIRNKLNESATTGAVAGRSPRPTTPLSTSQRGGSRTAHQPPSGARGRSQTRDTYIDDYRAGSRASSRASSRAGSRNQSRDSSLTRMRSSSAMSHREQGRATTTTTTTTPRRPTSARAAPVSASMTPRKRASSVTNLCPDTTDHRPAVSPDEQLTCQTQLLDRDPQDAHTPKPRKDKREGRTRIPMPVDMLSNGKYDGGEQPLRRYDSGVDINNMSPTESSVHGDDNWQQELIVQSDENALQFASSSPGYNVTSGGRVNGQTTSYDDMY